MSILFALIACTTSQIDPFEVKSVALIETLSTEEPLNTVAEDALSLAELGVPVVKTFMVSHPECEDYLTAALKVLDLLQTIDTETIERDYHKDGALPSAPSICYHAKDLVVHPATVVVMARERHPDREAMREEITEVLGHLSAVRAEIQRRE